MSKAILELILSRVSYKPNWQFRVGEMGEGFFLQAAFFARDAQTQEPEYWHARKWYVSTHATESEVVQTALKAVLTAEEHEAREQFRYKGKVIFGPHLSVERLIGVADQVDVRA